MNFEMRTATTIARTHEGKWMTLSYPSVSIPDQIKQYRTLIQSRSHPEFAFIQYQESDQPSWQFNFQPQPKFTAPIPMKNKKHLVAALVTAFALIALPIFAGLQPDGTLNGGTNTVPVAVTNQYRGTIFNAPKSGQVTFEFSFVCTNANAMKVGDGPTFTLDVGVNPSNTDLWQSNALKFVVPNAGVSNTATLLTNLPAGQVYPYYRVGQIWNTNVSGTNFTGVKVRCFTKDGI